ncbi:MAG: pantoate--beta-alanine ligase [Rhodospirillaceae bacterium]|jgi:pantoate--beta-alanine ligase|nr:pantoate--beta-alanine ligase [Rhodospirillaceae bacterium]MBT5244879.1 pantoate--beta-alanine ligase [Rhodospirillaceae bacterium]MBT5562731.1 pantoate--beta-alanine ligase [Rhodospirillaceae bacterium]MBT6242960.1 pantoate--beta-alanine ligase [Rhodospirillaceae bacterium]MBT7138091.1 pantoate--beta-alanine ligase [Rhodospirillaceae bacterium]
MDIVRSVDDLRERVADWRGQGLNVGLVPTMGALHSGHMALAGRSVETMERTIASLFINPKQFGQGEDLESYPRNEQSDAEQLTNAGVDLLFTPTTEQMYPAGFATGVAVSGLGDILEGSSRPGFFDGVATVVCKLLNQAAVDAAFFGEKDYQQLLVIRTMARDLNIPTRIEGVATVREADGLALSSRNVYLSTEERQGAPALYKTICDVATKIKAGAPLAEAEAWGSAQIVAAGFAGVDYLSVVDSETLEPYDDASRPGRVLVAAQLGRARLIDNVAL